MEERRLGRHPASGACRGCDLCDRRGAEQEPGLGVALLDRGDDRFDPVLEQLSSLRFHFWSPALARVGAKARDLLQ